LATCTRARRGSTGSWSSAGWRGLLQASTTKLLRAAEAGAREAKRGLWADKAPVAPWGFRKAR
jgi:endonuclease YncB( thermonuclease family)